MHDAVGFGGRFLEHFFEDVHDASTAARATAGTTSAMCDDRSGKAASPFLHATGVGPSASVRWASNESLIIRATSSHPSIVAILTSIVLACAVCGAAEQTLPTNGTEVPFEGRKRATVELRAASFETTDRALRVVNVEGATPIDLSQTNAPKAIVTIRR